VDVGRVLLYRPPVRRSSLVLRSDPGRVEVITATAGADGALIEAAYAAGMHGLVVSAMGRGNVPPAMAEAIGEVIQKGMPVVICSRCWGGRVAPVYGYAGA